MSEGINLIAPNKKGNTDIFLKRIQATRLIMIAILFIVSVASVILFILVSLSPLPALQAQEQSLRQTLSQSKNDIVKYELINERAVAIAGILKDRSTPDKIIAVVQSKLTSDMQITAIKLDNKTITLTVESSSLHSLDNFISGLIGMVQDKKVFSNITLTNLTTDQKNSGYAASMSLDLL